LDGRGKIVNLSYKIIPHIGESFMLKVHPGTANAIGFRIKKLAYVRFGIKCCEVKIETSKEIGPQEILLSYEVIEELKLPTSLMYEAKVYKNEIILGPFIGLLAERTDEALQETVDNLKSYIYGYENIGGAVVAFSIEGIDMSKLTIKGYIYNPQKDTWEKGVFNYPASIFKKVNLSRTIRNHFQSMLGSTVFNNYVFNKWQAYQWLENFETIKKYLPHTVLYSKIGDVKELLKVYGSIYIKPIYGSQGKGIVKIEKKEDVFLASYSIDGEKKDEIFFSQRELNKFIKEYLIKEKYIIQRALELISSNDSSIDFRLMLLKGQFDKWKEIGIIGRHGVSGSITSNVSTGGSAEIGEVTLETMLKLFPEEACILSRKMKDIALEVAKGLEESGIICGNLGIDMAIDRSGDIWIIEINNLDPNHTIAIDAKDKQMFYQARLMNMLFAKRLAGF
jgi:hypothetical protein